MIGYCRIGIDWTWQWTGRCTMMYRCMPVHCLLQKYMILAEYLGTGQHPKWCLPKDEFIARDYHLIVATSSRCLINPINPIILSAPHVAETKEPFWHACPLKISHLMSLNLVLTIDFDHRFGGVGSQTRRNRGDHGLRTSTAHRPGCEIYGSVSPWDLRAPAV